MPDSRKMPRLLPLFMVTICFMVYFARPAPVGAGTKISSDVISAAGDTARSESYMIQDTFGQGPIGPVATDTNIELYDGFWSTLAVAAPDTEPPLSVVTFEAKALDEEVYLEWTNPSDDDLAGTVIRYSTVTFPVSPDSGDPAWGSSGEFPGMPDSSYTYSHFGLTNGTTYYYAAFAYDLSRNYSAATSDSATPFDGVPPGGVTIQLPEPGDMQVTLRWTNPSDADFDHTLVRYSTVTYPALPGDGSPVDNGNNGMFPNSSASADSFVHTGLVNGTKYYYGWFAGDEVPNYSAPQTVSEIPQDIYPPGDVEMAGIDVQADGSIKVLWQAPDDEDLEGVLVRYSVDHPPVGISDGLPVPNRNDGRFSTEPAATDTFHHKGLVSDTTHFYAIFTYDEIPNYSSGVRMQARPHDETPPELALSVFQNPYLTNYLDIYLVGSETLVGTSVYCTVNGEEVDMDIADALENVWSGDYDLHTTGIDTVYARAQDVNLNMGEATHEFSSTLILRTAGGTARSADGGCSVGIPPGAVSGDAYILIFENPVENRGILQAYRISPPGLSLNGFAEISVAFADDMGEPEHLAIARIEGDGITPVDSYLDKERGRVIAYVNRLGTYGLLWRPDVETPLYGKGDFIVLQNIPNPFAGSTNILYEIPRVGHVRADIITIDGRLVCELHDGLVIPGRHGVEWDGKDANGQKVASGVYFYRVRFDTKTITKKMVHLR
jgi:hypothetical protein